MVFKNSGLKLGKERHISTEVPAMKVSFFERTPDASNKNIIELNDLKKSKKLKASLPLNIVTERMNMTFDHTQQKDCGRCRNCKVTNKFHII